jgi:hypothetical protein
LLAQGQRSANPNAQSDATQPSPEPPKSIEEQNKAAADALADYKRKRDAANAAQGEDNFGELQQEADDAANKYRKLRDANPEYQAQVQSLGVTEANRTFNRQRTEENQQAQQQAELAQQQAQARKDAYAATPEGMSRDYDKKLADWREHHSQTLPDGTWGLASEYNAKKDQEYQAKTGVDPARARQQEEDAKEKGLPLIVRVPPLPIPVPFESQGAGSYSHGSYSRYAESDKPPEIPVDYVPPKPPKPK